MIFYKEERNSIKKLGLKIFFMIILIFTFVEAIKAGSVWDYSLWNQNIT